MNMDSKNAGYIDNPIPLEAQFPKTEGVNRKIM